MVMSMFCLDKLRLGGFMPVDGFSFRVWMESSVEIGRAHV